MSRAAYLGDSVYAELDGPKVKLTAWPCNEIYLEDYVLQALLAWLQEHKVITVVDQLPAEAPAEPPQHRDSRRDP